MIRMKIEMDREKIIREKQYRLDDIYAWLDDILTQRGGFTQNDGFYEIDNNKDAMARLIIVVEPLIDAEWFLPNVKTWEYYKENEFGNWLFEDWKAHFLGKSKKSA